MERVVRGAGGGDEPKRSLPAPRPGVTDRIPVYGERHVVGLLAAVGDLR